MKTVTLGGLLWCAMLGQLAHGQGTFQNLRFDSAVITPLAGDPYQRVSFADAFPDWTGYVGGTKEDLALCNNLYLGSSGIGIMGAPGYPPFQGAFTAVLMAGVRLGTPEKADATLSQTAMVPSNAQSLRFMGQLGAPGSTSFDAVLGGQVLPLTVLSSTARYQVYGADVHGFAGQVATLAFTVHSDPDFGGTRVLWLDAVSFSATPVPEPAGSWLLALGLLSVGWWSLRSRLSGRHA